MIYVKLEFTINLLILKLPWVSQTDINLLLLSEHKKVFGTFYPCIFRPRDYFRC